MHTSGLHVAVSGRSRGCAVPNLHGHRGSGAPTKQALSSPHFTDAEAEPMDGEGLSKVPVPVGGVGRRIRSSRLRGQTLPGMPHNMSPGNAPNLCSA